jgi:hypothetical protein
VDLAAEVAGLLASSGDELPGIVTHPELSTAVRQIAIREIPRTGDGLNEDVIKKELSVD